MNHQKVLESTRKVCELYLAIMATLHLKLRLSVYYYRRLTTYLVARSELQLR